MKSNLKDNQPTPLQGGIYSKSPGGKLAPMRSALWLAFFTVALLPAPAADWPRFRGPDLNGISRDSGWNSSWSDAREG